MKTLPSNIKSVALCYIRLSLSREESDTNSPDRQRANIQAVCAKNEWTPRWFEDTDGHMSGRTENRPGWQELKTHLNDFDVVAIVANDLSRLHRRIGRMSDLLDECERLGLKLIQAAPGRDFDTSTPTGKMFANFQAMFDQSYADDVSYRMKDSAQYRRAKGIVVGMVPFGTIRPLVNGKSGYLELNPCGVWLLANGSIIEGCDNSLPPEPDAIWRGYAQAAQRALELYAENQCGTRRISEILNQEGFRHSDVRKGIKPPSLFNFDHVRSIVASWPEYGGVVIGRKDGIKPAELTPDSVRLLPDRAVFDIDLLYRVARVWATRTREHRLPDYNVPGNAAAYPLSNILYCAHCEQLVAQSGDPTYRAWLTGKNANASDNRQPRYRHKETRHQCTAQNASVRASMVETDFVRLVKTLSVNPEAIPLIVEWYNRSTQSNLNEDERAGKTAEIRLYQQRLRNAKNLFLNADITEQEYRERVTVSEQAIARLQAELSERNYIREMVQITANQLINIDLHWENATDEERQQFARNLFTEIVYDLDARRIVGFKLKPWAEIFMQLRVALHELFPSDREENEMELGGSVSPLSITKMNALFVSMKKIHFNSLN